MVKFDVSLMRFFEDEDFRVLTALEMAMRNHDVAPTALVERIAQLPRGGCRKRLQDLLKRKFIHHENTAYDGYSMKYAAYDFLALRALSKRGTVTGAGSRIGCGKESDIILVQDENGNDCVMKLQRLGRCSFRTVSRNRDYKGNGKTRRGESWFYLSRLAAQKEFAFMKMLYDEGFPVPKPIDHNRHVVIMELVKGTLLNHIQDMGGQENKVYERCLALMVRLAEHGLIHGDFNEFNIMITDDFRVIMIDFPQMVSTDHRNAVELFDRDVQNLANFFSRRFRVETLLHPSLERDVERSAALDRQAFASGFFTKKQQMELEAMLEEDIDAEEEEDEEEEENEESEEACGDVETTTAKKSSTRHTDPVAEAKDNADDDDAEEDEEGDSMSETDTIAETKRQRLNQVRRDVKDNPNLVGSGVINMEYVKKRMKSVVKRDEDREFNRNMHRNSQKGRSKQKIQRELKNTKDFSLFD
jgi:RIO kinase 2